MKKYIFIYLCGIMFSGLIFQTSYGAENTCSYIDKVNTCMNSDAKRSLDFMCIDGSQEEVLYQIILDEEFTKIDDKIDTYLIKIEEEKGKYFGKDKTANFIDGINEIERSFAVYGDYRKEYNKVCWLNIVKKVQTCQGGSASIDVAEEYLSGIKCMDLVKTKLHISRQVAYNILMLNKQQVGKDEQKKYVKQERTKYDKLLDAFMINLGYLQRILHKWPSKITNPK